MENTEEIKPEKKFALEDYAADLLETMRTKRIRVKSTTPRVIPLRTGNSAERSTLGFSRRERSRT